MACVKYGVLYDPRNWERLGISQSHQNELVLLIERSHRALHGILSPMFESIDGEIAGCISEFGRIQNAYGLEDLEQALPGEGERLGWGEGIEYAEKMLEQGRVVGLSGAPAVGKSTVLQQLEARGHFCIDEYWEEGSGNGASFDDKRAELSALRKGNGVLVAAALLEQGEVDVLLHCTAGSSHRRGNLERRAALGSQTDVLRLRSYELSRLTDFFQYDVQRINAQRIIDTSAIRLY